VTVLLIAAGLLVAWVAGIGAVLWWMRREHPGAYFALLYSMKIKREGKQ
jgi:hypothetical protein